MVSTPREIGVTAGEADHVERAGQQRRRPTGCTVLCQTVCVRVEPVELRGKLVWEKGL